MASVFTSIGFAMRLAFTRMGVLATRDAHDANKQRNGYDRCEICQYTRHPCDVFLLAEDWLTMFDAIGRE